MDRLTSLRRSLFSPLRRLAGIPLLALRAFVPAAAQPSTTRRKQRVQLSIEGLEDRLCPATDFWTGAGTSDNWDNSANWVNAKDKPVTPVQGDTLVFGSSVFGTNVKSRVSANDFGPGMQFNAIQISAEGYLIQGNMVQLNAGPGTQGIGISNSLGLSTVALDITLGANQTFTNDAGSTLILSGSINNNGHLLTVNPNGGDILYTGNSISGAGGLDVEGNNYAGRFLLEPRYQDTYTGVTMVTQAGVLFLDATQGNAIAGNLVVGDGPGPAQNDVVHLAANNQVANTSQVTVYQDGLFDLNGFTNTIGSLTMTGGFVTTGTGTLTLNGDVTTQATDIAAVIEGNLSLGTGAGTRTFTVGNGGAGDDLDIKAVISGAGRELLKTGGGALNLSMDNTYSGQTLVSAGTLLAGSTDALGAGNVTVTSGATLEYATADTNSLLVNGNLTNAGVVEFFGIPTGTLALHGNYDQIGGTLDMGLASTSAFDQMTVSGNAVLSGTLSITPKDGFEPAGGNQFPIMTFASSTGQFSTVELPHANVLSLNYDPRDLTIVDTAPPVTVHILQLPPPGAFVWTGAGSNDNWTNAQNWQGDVAPKAGDILYFPVAPVSLVSNNNFAAGTSFASIIMAGSGYQISGNAVQFQDGLTAENSSGTNTVTLPLSFSGPETITDTNPGTMLVLGGSLNNGGNLLTVNVAGNVVFQGPSISGSGGLMVEGAGTLTLADTAADTYTGKTEVSSGTLVITNSAALSPETVVDDGATLELDGVMVSAADDLKLNGMGVNGAGALQAIGGTDAWYGTINLVSTTAIATSAGTTLTIGTSTAKDVISGLFSSNLTFMGNGTVVLAGHDSYHGYTTVESGILALDNLNALTSAPINGGRGTDVESGATLQLWASGSYALAPLQITGTGVGGQGALVSVNGDNTWVAPIKLGGNATITCNANSTFTDNVQMPNEGYTLTVNAIGAVNLGGTISGAGGLIKDGPGTLTFDYAPNLYAGTTVINDGTLLADKNVALPSITGAGVIINAGGTLAGTGLIATNVIVNPGGTLGGSLTIDGNVINNGLVSPGGMDNIGALMINGNYTQQSGGVLDMELASMQALDQLMISGQATLTGALNVSLLNGFQPKAKNHFEILTFGERSGSFSTVNLPNPGNGVTLEALYDPMDPMDLMIEALASSLS